MSHADQDERIDDEEEEQGDIDNVEDNELIGINEEDILAVYDLDDNDAPDQDVESDSGDDVTPDEQASIVYRGHKDSVFCVSSDPVRCNLVVSGGQDDTAHWWNVNTGDALHTTRDRTGVGDVGLHSDSVTHVSYSSDGVYVCTGDMRGVINIWSSSHHISPLSDAHHTSVISHVKTYDMALADHESSCIHWLQWHPGAGAGAGAGGVGSGKVLLAGSSESVWMWQVPSDVCKVFTPGSEGPATQAAILSDGMRLFCGHEQGDLRCWDLKTTDTIYFIHHTSGSHSSSITCMCVHPAGSTSPLLLTGALDGHVKLTNYNTGKVMSTLVPRVHGGASTAPGATSESAVSIEDVAFSPSESYLACSVTNSGLITIWDLNTSIPRHNIMHTCCVSRLLWPVESVECGTGRGGAIYCGDSAGCVSVWDVRSGSLITTYTGHTSHILDMIIVLTNTTNTTTTHGEMSVRKLVTASDDGTCRVFDIRPTQ